MVAEGIERRRQHSYIGQMETLWESIRAMGRAIRKVSGNPRLLLSFFYFLLEEKIEENIKGISKNDTNI